MKRKYSVNFLLAVILLIHEKKIVYHGFGNKIDTSDQQEQQKMHFVMYTKYAKFIFSGFFVYANGNPDKY